MTSYHVCYFSFQNNARTFIAKKIHENKTRRVGTNFVDNKESRQQCKTPNKLEWNYFIKHWRLYKWSKKSKAASPPIYQNREESTHPPKILNMKFVLVQRYTIVVSIQVLWFLLAFVSRHNCIRWQGCQLWFYRTSLVTLLSIIKLH